MKEKKTLRKSILTQRSQLNAALKKKYDTSVCEKLEQLVLQKKCKTVHCFLPMGDEINIYPFLEYLLDNNIQVICPKTLKNRKLDHFVLDSLEELETGLWGTRHPAGNQVYKDAIDLIIVPGLAFDKKGNRLGYGAGYYDNFLVQYPMAYKLAVAYPFQLVDMVPTEEHDAGVNEVLLPL